MFKHFTFIDLFDSTKNCLCSSAKRLKNFLDPKTLDELSSFAPAALHVRTTNVNIIQHTDLKKAVSMGLNHIPLRPTAINLCMFTILEAFEQVATILQLRSLGFPIDVATKWLKTTALNQLKTASRTNKYGFRISHQEIFSLTAVRDELAWITENLFCSGLDKAANKCCFIYIRHLRFMALERLSSPDYQPCKDDNTWLLRSHMLLKVCTDLTNIVLELIIPYEALPYIMATYKQHKQKYGWLTNAAHTAYSEIAHVITISNSLILDSVQQWAVQKAKQFATFLGAKTSLFWLVNSAIEVRRSYSLK